MTALTEARFAVAAVRRRRELAMRAVTDAEIAGDRYRDLDGAIAPDTGTYGEEWSAGRRAAVEAIDAARAELQSAEEAYEQAYGTYAGLAGAAPLFEAGCVDPVLLLPIRLEAVYRATPAGEPELHVRVYPDDVHVDSHEPELTQREWVAGTAYWRDVRAAGTEPGALERRRAAWHVLTGAVGGQRATWVRDALTPSDGGVGAPAFPDVPRRPTAWNRAAHTLLLPDRFAFSAYRDGALVWRHEGADLPDRLPLGIAPQAEGDAESDLSFDDASRWLVDFRAAVALGMGLVVPLPSAEERYDLLTVVGVSRVDAATGAARVQDALAAHAWTSGVTTIPVGTPTTNTPGSRSGWRTRGAPPDPDTVAQWLDRYDPRSRQDAARLARALGIDGAPVLARVCDPGAEDESVLRTAHRIESDLAARSWLWHPSGPHDNVYEDPDPPAWFPTAQRHFTEFVRGRGPLPPLRVGRQPYGVLPTSSVQLWRAAGDEATIARVVGSFHDALSEFVGRAAQVGEAADQDAELLDLLSRDPAPQWFKGWEAWLYGSILETRAVPPATIGAVPFRSRWAKVFSQATPQTPEDLALPDAPPPYEPQVVEPFPDEIPPALQRFLAQRPLAQLLDLFDGLVREMESTHPPEPISHAAIDDLLDAVAAHQNTLWQVTQAPTYSFFYSQALDVADRLGATLKVAQPTVDNLVRAAATARALVGVLAVYRSLEDEAAADLPGVERLVREAKHPLSLRVDAWVTSLSTRRLDAHRTTAPSGVRTGAYGWLMDVEARTPNPSREGYVVTPSLHHATTAAVLRSGWQAHQDKRAFAVDIQSTRVRRAQALVDGVRGGQTVSALLGYQFERGLHDAELDRFVPGFRAAYPLAALVQPAVEDHQQARVSVGARNVVDGQALRLDRASLLDPGVLTQRAGSDPGGDAGTLLRLVAELDETFDAAADLLLAESVHQLVGGSALRAGLTVDAVGRGQELPRDFEVLRTPRSGTSLTHHVGLLLSDRFAPGSGWSDDRPLARLEPGLENWVRSRLGATAGWRCGSALSALGWCGLDLLLASPGELRVAAATGEGAVDEAELDRLEVLCSGLRGVLATAQPLVGAHLGSSGPAVELVDLAELHHRVGPWLDAVRTAAGALEAAEEDDAVAVHLETLAAHGVAAGPGSPAGARDQLLDRLQPLHELDPVPSVDEDLAAAEAWLGDLLAMTAAVLPPWLVIAPLLRAELPARPEPPPHADEVGDWWRDMTLVRPGVAAFDEAVLLCEVAGHGATFAPEVFQPTGPEEAHSPWLATAPAPEQPGSRLSLVLDVSTAGDRPRGLVVDSWTEVVPRRPPAVAADGTAYGPEEVVGVAFDFDRPDSRAPQSLLLAVPPDPGRGWCTEDLHACVEETLHLARVRALVLQDVPELSRQLPLPLGVPAS